MWLWWKIWRKLVKNKKTELNNSPSRFKIIYKTRVWNKKASAPLERFLSHWPYRNREELPPHTELRILNNKYFAVVQYRLMWNSQFLFLHNIIYVLLRISVVRIFQFRLDSNVIHLRLYNSYIDFNVWIGFSLLFFFFKSSY